MNEQQMAIAAAAERLFAALVDVDVRNRAEQGQMPQKLMMELDQAGFLSMLKEDSEAVSGVSLADAAVVLRAAGFAAAPGPILETIVARRVLAAAGFGAPQGPLALLFAARPGSPWHECSLNAAWIAQAEAVVLVEHGDDGDALLSLHAPAEMRCTRFPHPAAEPLYCFFDAPARGDNVRASREKYAVIFRTAALLRAAQCVGALEWAFARTAAYATERKQFGREIARFQAVQQQVAEFAGVCMAASVIVEAATQAGAGDEQAPLVAAARARVADAIDLGVRISHQVHGAIGFSLEYELNFRTRRLMTWRDSFGSARFWSRELARYALRGGAFWRNLTAVALTGQHE